VDEFPFFFFFCCEWAFREGPLLLQGFAERIAMMLSRCPFRCPGRPPPGVSSFFTPEVGDRSFPWPLSSFFFFGNMQPFFFIVLPLFDTSLLFVVAFPPFLPRTSLSQRRFFAELSFSLFSDLLIFFSAFLLSGLRPFNYKTIIPSRLNETCSQMFVLE